MIVAEVGPDRSQRRRRRQQGPLLGFPGLTRRVQLPYTYIISKRYRIMHHQACLPPGSERCHNWLLIVTPHLRSDARRSIVGTTGDDPCWLIEDGCTASEVGVDFACVFLFRVLWHLALTLSHVRRPDPTPTAAAGRKSLHVKLLDCMMTGVLRYSLLEHGK